MSQTIRIRSASRTNKGNVRQLNEDSCVDLTAKRLWAVADGMGGHAGGDIASGMIAEALRNVAREDTPARFLDAVEDAVIAVNERLCDMSSEREPGTVIGSTLAMLIGFPSHCLVAWVGDSRVYRLRDRDFGQMTRDHSEVEELIARGAITREESKDHASSNVVTRAIGGTRQLFVDLDLLDLEPGDRFLICSDGLYKELSDAELAEFLSVGDVDEACEELMAQALRRECRDNVTAIVVEFVGGEESDGDADATAMSGADGEPAADESGADDDADRTVQRVP